MTVEIIINDVNVSKCELLHEFYKRDGYTFYKWGCKLDLYCEKNPNCSFKQLQRKTAECDILRNHLRRQDIMSSEKIENLSQKIKKIKKDNFELRKNLFFTEESREIFINENKKLKKEINKQRLSIEHFKQENENIKYHLKTNQWYNVAQKHSEKLIKIGNLSAEELCNITAKDTDRTNTLIQILEIIATI